MRTYGFIFLGVVTLSRAALATCPANSPGLTASGNNLRRGGQVIATWCIPTQYLTPTSFVGIFAAGEPNYSRNVAGWMPLSSNSNKPPESGSVTVNIYDYIGAGSYNLRVFLKSDDFTATYSSLNFNISGENSSLCPIKIKPQANVRLGMDSFRVDYCELQIDTGSPIYSSGWFALYQEGEIDKNNYYAWKSVSMQAPLSGNLTLYTTSPWMMAGQYYIQHYLDSGYSKPGYRSAAFTVAPTQDAQAVTLTATVGANGISVSYSLPSTVSTQGPWVGIYPAGGDLYSAVNMLAVSGLSGTRDFPLPPTGSYVARFYLKSGVPNAYKETPAFSIVNHMALVTVTPTVSAHAVSVAYTVPSALSTQSPRIAIYAYGATPSATPFASLAAPGTSGSLSFSLPATGTYIARYFPKTADNSLYKDSSGFSLVSPADVSLSASATGLVASVTYSVPLGLLTKSPSIKIFAAEASSTASPLHSASAAGTSGTLNFTLAGPGSFVARYQPSSDSTAVYKQSSAFSVSNPMDGISLTASVTSTSVVASYNVPTTVAKSSPYVALYAPGSSSLITSLVANGSSGTLSFSKPAPGSYVLRYVPMNSAPQSYKESASFTIIAPPPATCPVSIYASPDGRSEALGLQDEPVDIYTARDRAVAILNDQAKACPVTIYLASGNYYLTRPIYIPPMKYTSATNMLRIKPTSPQGVVNLSGGIPFNGTTSIGSFDQQTIDTVSGQKTVSRFRFTDSQIRSRLQSILTASKSVANEINAKRFVFNSFTMNSVPMNWAQYAKYDRGGDPSAFKQNRNMIRVSLQDYASAKLGALFDTGNIIAGFSTVFQWSMARVKSQTQAGGFWELELDMEPSGQPGNEVMKIDGNAAEHPTNLFNDLAFVDDKNEFWVNDALDIYFIPPTTSLVETSAFELSPSGKSIPESHFTLAVLDSLIVFDKEPAKNGPPASISDMVRYVSIEGIRFHDTKWTMTNGAENPLVRYRFHSQGQGTPYLAGAIEGKYVDHITIKDGSFNNIGGTAIRLGGSWAAHGHSSQGAGTNNLVSNNDFGYIGGGAIHVSSGKPDSGSILSNGQPTGRDIGEVPVALARGSLNTISNNRILYASSFFRDAVPILTMRTVSTDIVDNTIDWCNWACIHLGYGPAFFPEAKNVIRNNTMSRGIRLLADGTVIFVSSTHAVITQNRVGPIQRGQGAIPLSPQAVSDMTIAAYRGDAWGAYTLLADNVLDSAGVYSVTVKTARNTRVAGGATRYCKADHLSVEGLICPSKKDEPKRAAEECKPAWWDQALATYGPFDPHPSVPFGKLDCDP